MTPSNKLWFTLLQILACLLSAVYAADFYKLLGISRDAEKKEIKKAYRQKSLEFHPDKNKAEGAAEKFAEIARAYEVLSDDEKKGVYDKQGEEGLKQHEQRGGGGGGGGFDPFESFFGGGFGGRRRGDEEQRTPDVEIPLHVTMQQLYLGEQIEVEYHRQTLCLNWEMCMKSNNECSGPGIRVVRQQLAPGFVQQVQQRDERCIARGKMWHKNCKECPSSTQTEKIDLTIDLQPGLREGERVSFEEVTDEKPGHKAGDLHFLVIEEPHSEYHREKDNLYKTIEIPLVDALIGFEMTMKQLDDTEFTITVDDVIDCDHVLRVPGKGMPRRNGRGFGDLYITFEVDFPVDLSDSQKVSIAEILGRPDSDSSEDAEKRGEL